MSKEIIINAEEEQTRIAIVENGTLAELHFENPENVRTLGDIYLGRIERLMPSIQGAFVTIGEGQDAFLSFSDLPENLEALLRYLNQRKPNVQRFFSAWFAKESRGSSRGKAESPDRSTDSNGAREPRRGSPELLRRNQLVLVQTTKEAMGNKGARVSCNISLAGRFLVLVPLARFIAVSKKISAPKERRRLEALIKMLLPEGFGVIVRTAAKGKDAKVLDTDIQVLLEKWRKLEKQLEARPRKPMRVHEDVSMASSIIRDLFSNAYDRVLVDQLWMYRKFRSYIKAIAPHKLPVVQLHKGSEHIFEATHLAKDIAQVFDRQVNLPSGGHLIFEKTEAMYVVDVNSGSSSRHGQPKEENHLQVNLEAVSVLARQIRLRDMGGIIVIDFIDMDQYSNRKRIFQALREQFRHDRAITKVLPMSTFGVIQMTRQRLRPSITVTHGHSDAGIPEQQHKGSPEVLVSSIEEWLNAYEKKGSQRAGITLHLHPFAVAYLERGLVNQRLQWAFRYRMRIRVAKDHDLDITTFRCSDIVSDRDITDLTQSAPASPRAAKKTPSTSRSPSNGRAPARSHPQKKRRNTKRRPAARPRPKSPAAEARPAPSAKKTGR